ncbi:hypothetical protein [Glutamicibacter sp. BW77]|uniref:DNA-3-methyladenine glycosylase II n=1 Tax=Glutamicibacter bergerei TaxID=256702 RepID=A0ABV9MLQ8_9MICC|nr:hypothetical protein [Glutamicibacter sp. BW77]PCC37497.1 hypothetical protein CIK74_00335 [Glutamicibacter sp. BW77]HBV08716.1 hypothetical protein [Micrococcaceae bacterium]
MIFTLPVSGVLDIAHTLSVLKVHSLANQEILDFREATIKRVLRLGRECYATKLWFSATEITLETQAPQRLQTELVKIINSWLGLEQAQQQDYAKLETLDALKPAAQRFPHLRLIGYPDLFEALMTTVLGQQISTSAARTLATRYVQEIGQLHECGLHVFPDALSTSEHTAEELQQIIRCPLSRAQTVQRVAHWYVHTGQYLAANQENFLDDLQTLKGVGPWTRDYVALRGLRQNSIFLRTDLVVKRSLTALGVKHNDTLQIPDGAGSLATVLLWALDAKKN